MLQVDNARQLHNRMFVGVIKSPTSFFDANPSGRILNRFSKDIGFIDDSLPFLFHDVMHYISATLAAVASIAIASPYILIVAAGFAVACVALRQFYVPAALKVCRRRGHVDVALIMFLLCR